jgi:hypothetical protein
MRISAWPVVVLLAGCDYSVSRVHSWSEEVDTGDGRTILVDRKAQARVSNVVSPDPGLESGPRWVITFTGEFAKLPAWDEALVPVLLYADPATSRWTVVATTTSCENWMARGRPVPPDWEFRLTGDGWSPVELSDASLGRDANLYLDGYGDMPMSPISLAAKREARKRAGIPGVLQGIRRDVRLECNAI